MTLTVGSLFSGIGGLDLGLERAGMKVRWQCEIDPYCQKVLRKHWPETVIYDDVTKLRGSDVERVDVLCGGFPCQDVSTAGKRAGIKEGTRSGLWAEYARLIGEIEPRWVIIENVPGLLSIDVGRGMGKVLYDLAVRGYDAEWDCISAASVGALHRRDRIFIVAHANGSGLFHGQAKEQPTKAGEYALGEPFAEGPDVANAEMSERQLAGDPRPGGAGPSNGGQIISNTTGGGDHSIAGARVEREWPGAVEGWEARLRDEPRNLCQVFTRCPARIEWPTESGFCRVANGIPSRVDRLRALGNAVVPQVAEHIGRLIVEAEGGSP